MRLGHEDIARMRSTRYRTAEATKLRSIDEAATFVDESGLVTLFGCKGVELPSLYAATYDTRDFRNTWWGWKDNLCATKASFYGRLLERKAYLASWELFRCFFALSGSGGELDEYLYEYRRGRLGATGKAICEWLLAHGPTPTDSLRDAVHMSDKRVKAAFEKALLDLQASFSIVKVGSVDRRWGTDVWDLTPRWLPEQVSLALGIEAGEARRTIVSRYLRTACAVPKGRFARHLGWSDATLGQTVAELRSSGILSDDVEVGDELVPSLAYTAYLEATDGSHH